MTNDILLPTTEKPSAVRRPWVSFGLLVAVCLFITFPKVVFGPYSFMPWLDEGVGVPPLLARTAMDILRGFGWLWNSSQLGGADVFLYPGQSNLYLILYLLLPTWGAFSVTTFLPPLFGGWFAYLLFRDQMRLAEPAAVGGGLMFVMASPMVHHSELVASFTGLTHYAIPFLLLFLNRVKGRGLAVVIGTALGIGYGLLTSTAAYSYNVFILLALWPLVSRVNDRSFYYGALFCLGGAYFITNLPFVFGVFSLGDSVSVRTFWHETNLFQAFSNFLSDAAGIIVSRSSSVGFMFAFPVVCGAAMIFGLRSRSFIATTALATIFLLTWPVHSTLFGFIGDVVPAAHRLRPRAIVPTVFVIVVLNAVAINALWKWSRNGRAVSLFMIGALSFLFVSHTFDQNLTAVRRLANGDNIQNLFYHPEVLALAEEVKSRGAPSRVAVVDAFMGMNSGLVRSIERFHPLFLVPSGLNTLGGVAPALSDRLLVYWNILSRRPADTAAVSAVIMADRIYWDKSDYSCSPKIPTSDLNSIMRSSLLASANVNWIVSPIPLESAGWRLTNQEVVEKRLQELCLSTKEKLKRLVFGSPVFSPLFIYESREPALPRAYFSPSPVLVKAEIEVASALTNYVDGGGLRPAVLVAVPGLSDQLSDPACKQAKAAISQIRSDLFVVETSSDARCFLVVSNSFHKRWHVDIDGVAALLVPANVAFQGVVVPKGKHRVTFRYSLI